MHCIDSYYLILGSATHCLVLHEATQKHCNHAETCSYSCKETKLLAALNVLVRCTPQLVISAWPHSSASYESALIQLRHTGIHTKVDTCAHTHRR